MSVGIIDLVVRIMLVLATASLFMGVFLAYRRLKNSKMLLISVGFGIFFAHALISLPEPFNNPYDTLLNENMHLFIILIALIFILLGTLRD
jgi:hypothetical protein